jgi:hypothetical protein
MNQYRDYQDTESRDHDMNNTLVGRVFDVPRQKSSGGVQVIPYQGMVPCPSDLCTGEPMRPFVDQSSSSPEYLRMKHAQELETLMGNPRVTQIAIDRLRERQFDETKKLSEYRKLQHANKYQMMHKTAFSEIKEPPSVVHQPPQQPQHKPRVTELQRQLQQRQNQILATKTSELQSYKNPQCGVDLNQAYKIMIS